MRISDWSSDVCSSDLRGVRAGAANPRALCRRKLGSLVDGRGRVMKLSSLSAQRSRAPWLPLLCHFRPTIECASVIEFRVAPVAEPEVEPGQILSHRAKPIRRDMKQMGLIGGGRLTRKEADLRGNFGFAKRGIEIDRSRKGRSHLLEDWAARLIGTERRRQLAIGVEVVAGRGATEDGVIPVFRIRIGSGFKIIAVSAGSSAEYHRLGHGDIHHLRSAAVSGKSNALGIDDRPAARRVGEECVSTGSSRWWPTHSQNKT